MSITSVMKEEKLVSTLMVVRYVTVIGILIRNPHTIIKILLF